MSSAIPSNDAQACNGRSSGPLSSLHAVMLRLAAFPDQGIHAAGLASVKHEGFLENSDLKWQRLLGDGRSDQALHHNF